MAKDMRRAQRREFERLEKDYEKHLKNGDNVVKPKRSKKASTKAMYVQQDLDGLYGCR